MLIKVTQEDIDGGITDDMRLCPIALAVRRITKEDLVEVDENTIYIETIIGRSPKLYKTSKTAKKFIQDFDAGEKVKPFSFKLSKENKNGK